MRLTTMKVLKVFEAIAFETAANAVIITDRSGAILRVNPAFVSLSGFKQGEVLGKTPRLLKSGEHDPQFYDGFWRTIAGGQTWRGEFINRRKDGSLYHVEHTVTPVRLYDGAITHFIGIMNDITARKQNEIRFLSFCQEMIAAREEERRHLSCALHHDVGSLAVGLSAYFDAMEQDLSSKRPRAAIEWMKRARLLFENSMADLKKLAVELRLPKTDILGVGAVLKAYFSQVSRQSGIRIHFREELGNARLTPETSTILFRVAQEALTNAIKHGRARQVNVHLHLLKRGIRLTIRDNGRGFEVSVPAVRVTSQLGLRLLGEIATSAGGECTIASEQGRGTTLRLNLPSNTEGLTNTQGVASQETIGRPTKSKSEVRCSRWLEGSQR